MDDLLKWLVGLNYGTDPFSPNLTVEEVANYKLLLVQSHFDYSEAFDF